MLDTFVQDALNANTTWMHAYPNPIGQASMAAYQNYVPANMVDGDPHTFYWSNFAPQPGDYVGIDLGTVRPVDGIDVLMAKTTSPDDYIHAGTIEYSADGTNWTSAGSFAGATEVKATFPAGTKARYLRLVDTGTQPNWVVVDEFNALTPPLLNVTGAPSAATGSSLTNAADSHRRAAGVPAADRAVVRSRGCARPPKHAGTGSGVCVRYFPTTDSYVAGDWDSSNPAVAIPRGHLADAQLPYLGHNHQFPNTLPCPPRSASGRRSSGREILPPIPPGCARDTTRRARAAQRISHTAEAVTFTPSGANSP